MQKTIIHSKQFLDKLDQLDRKIKSVRMQFFYYFIPKRSKITDSKKDPITTLANYQDSIEDIKNWEQYERDSVDAYMEKR